MNEYELLIEANIAANRRILEALLGRPIGSSSGLLPPPVAPKVKAKPKPRPSKAVARSVRGLGQPEPGSGSSPAQSAEASAGSPVGSSSRRSTRNTGKCAINYARDDFFQEQKGSAQRRAAGPRASGAWLVDDVDDEAGGGAGVKVGWRMHDPKTFGAIPGVEVGRWWRYRMSASLISSSQPLLSSSRLTMSLPISTWLDPAVLEGLRARVSILRQRHRAMTHTDSTRLPGLAVPQLVESQARPRTEPTRLPLVEGGRTTSMPAQGSPTRAVEEPI